MCTLGLKGSLYIIMSPIFVIVFYLFSCYITSSSNITSVYSMEHIPGVKKTCLLGNKIYCLKFRVYICLITSYFNSPDILSANKQI